MTTNIHPTAIIEPGAEIGHGVCIGPYAVIGPRVTLKDHVVIKSHVVIDGATTIGEATTIFPFASIGQIPQDKKYTGENSKLIIGSNNVIREYTTINTGTEGGGMITTIGNNSLFMASVHIAHDCKIGNNVIFANCVTLAGHVEVGDNAIIGGLSAVHQFVKIGRHAMIGGMSAIDKDVIPFGVALGDRAYLSGINLVGLKRHGFAREDINAIRNLYDLIFTAGKTNNFGENLQKIAEELKDNQHIMEIVNFITAETSKNRSICKPKDFHN